MGICCKFKKNLFNLLTLYTSFHDLINVYNPRSGTDNPRGQNFDVNRNLLSTWPFATSLKNLFKVWFFTIILYMYIAPGQGMTTPWGRNFDVNRNSLSLQSIVSSLKKDLFKVWFYTFFLMILYMCIAPGQGKTAPRGQSFDVNRTVLSLHSFVASLKKCLWSLILYNFFHDLIHVYSPVAGAESPQGTKFWCQLKGLITLPICCKFQRNLFDVCVGVLRRSNNIQSYKGSQQVNKSFPTFNTC